MAKPKKAEVALRALMSQRLNDGTRVARGERFTCVAQEARDRTKSGKAEPIEPPAAKGSAKADTASVDTGDR